MPSFSESSSLGLLDSEAEEVWMKAEEKKMHAQRSIETSGTTYPATQRNIAED